MRLRNFYLAAAGATVMLAACGDDPLQVDNVDSPDVARAYATPDGIEAILRTSFVQVLGATHGATGAMWPAMQSMAFESYATVANFGMNLRASLPRVPIENQRGNQTSGELFRDFSELSKRGRQIANGIAALDRLTAADGSLGSDVRDARARAFGFFTLGMANGELALAYDSAAVSTHLLASDEIPPLVGYVEAMDVALAQLDSAIRIATEFTGSGFEYPSDWMRLYATSAPNPPSMGSPMSKTDFIRTVRSLQARFRAGLARTPAERDAADWGAILADAENGIQQSIVFDLSATLGWGVPWLNQAKVETTWSTVPPPIIGMADTSGAYDQWLSQPPSARARFAIRTPDERFPPDNLGAATADEVRAAQIANSPVATNVLPRIYFRNHPAGQDTPGEAWANSQYDFARFWNYRQASSTGPWIWMAYEEISMLRAEALMRLGRDAEAVPFINASRVDNGGLPPFPAGSNKSTITPGGNACVPQVPQAPNFTTADCGTMWEAMKWEKRMETAFTGYGQWYIDGRGWGDLAENTTYQFPVPYQEMDSRRKAFYNSPWQAARGTYGF